MNASRLNHITYILIALLCVAVVVAICRSPVRGIEPMREAMTATVIEFIKEHLNEYRQEHGNYPERLENLPRLETDIFRDEWGIPYDYNPSDENGELVLRSIELEKRIVQRKIRSIQNDIAKGCLLVLAPLILYVRFRRDKRWPIEQSVMLLLPITLCFYIPLTVGLLLKMLQIYFDPPVLYFCAMFLTAPAVALISFCEIMQKRDILYFAALVAALYAWLFVFSLC